MTVKFLQKQLKQKSDKLNNFKESVEILTESVNGSNDASLKKSSNRLVDVLKAFRDDGAPRMYISTHMALYT